MEIVRTTLDFILKNFAPPIAFFVVFQTQGAKPAIGVAMAVALGQLIFHVVMRHKLSPFFLVASVFTVLFGGMDFLVKEPQFFKFEPFAENAVIGLVFAVTALAGKPIVLWFAQALPPVVRPELSDDMAGYLKRVTWVWVAYFFFKAFLFLYLAYQVDLGRLIVLRSAIGGSTLALLVLGEIFYRKRWRGRIRGR